MKKLIAATVLTMAAVQIPAHAGIEGTVGGVDISISGFGTYGVVHTNTNSAQFIRDDQPSGANDSISQKVDTNLGLQVTARMNSWLSATVQVLDQQHRYSQYMTADVPWAFVKIDPVTNLSIKLGRVELPLFAISDSRDINYVNTWIRPPDEVYSLANIELLDGGEATYSLPIGSTHLSVTAFLGNSINYISYASGAQAKLNAWDVKGGEVRWETDWVTVRAGYATSENELAPGLHDKYTFSGAGIIMDHDNIVAQVEAVSRRSAGYGPFVDSNGWYALGGYRFGKVLPYASYARTTKTTPYYSFFAPLTLNQHTTAVGVRWDAFKSADVKLQLERVDPEGTTGISFAQTSPGFGNRPVNVASLAVDFVF